MVSLSLWAFLLPLAAFVVQFLVGKRLFRGGDWVGISAIAVSFLLSTPAFLHLVSGSDISESLVFPWFQLLDHPNPIVFEAGVRLDNYSVILLCMVSLCSLLIQLFATGYMKDEARYDRFFAYLSLFTASMLGLVLSDSLLLFFIFWELMGVCSYLLIGFYREKPAAGKAAIRAFLTTRIGDTGLFLGLCAIFSFFGTSHWGTLYEKLPQLVGHEPILLGLPALSVIAFFILMGTIGKSAQVPLHVWLPGAMEGPTPVSALIHAATMVAAGVFLLIRAFPLLAAAPNILLTAAYIGGITALYAGLMAVGQKELKKVLAYSTISQLGLMVLAVGVGAVPAAFLHLITHAFFKACLFLGAGSVYHAAHTQNLDELGGLKKKMPRTFAAMLVGTLALSGLPFFSGFVSKDRILASVLAHSLNTHGDWLLVVFGFSAAGLTAFYMFRLMYLTFFGEAAHSDPHHEVHEQPWVMTTPVLLLALFCFSVWFAGPTGIEAFDRIFSVQWFDKAMVSVFPEAAIHGSTGVGAEEPVHFAHHLTSILTLLFSSASILLASLLYLNRTKGKANEERAERVTRKLSSVDVFATEKVLVGGTQSVVLWVKSAAGRFDNLIIDDGMVTGSSQLVASSGRLLRRLQDGRVQHYLVLTLALLGLIFFSLVR